MISGVRGLGLWAQLALTAVSAVSLVLAFPNFNLEFLAWVGLVPLFFAIENKKPLQAFFISYITGAIFFAGAIWWLVHVTLPGTILLVLYLALYFGLFGALAFYGLRFTNYGLLFFIPAAWVSTEWLRSHVFSGFGWVLIGHSQSYTLPVIQIADITGAYGVSFLIVMVNAGIYLALKSIRNISESRIPLTLMVFILFLSLVYGFFRLNNIFTGEKVRVGIVQGNIPQDKKWDAGYREYTIRKYEDLTLRLKGERPDVVVWPETSMPVFLEDEPALLGRIEKLAIDINAPLLVGAPREGKGDGAYHNSAILFSPEGRIAAVYDKLHLVPFGEFVPLKNVFSFVEKLASSPIGDFTSGREYTVFDFFIRRSSKDKDYSMRLVKKIKFAALICFEDVFPELSRVFVKKGALFLVNMTNDAWYKKTSAAHQHVQSSIFRAVENRVNVIRAANTGVSCFIDQKGRITDTVNGNGKDIFVDGFKCKEIVVGRVKTLYNTYGDLFAYGCLALCWGCLLLKYKKV